MSRQTVADLLRPRMLAPLDAAGTTAGCWHNRWMLLAQPLDAGTTAGSIAVEALTFVLRSLRSVTRRTGGDSAGRFPPPGCTDDVNSARDK
ncbi:unnamed protein product [Merluccius merluccius]